MENFCFKVLSIWQRRRRGLIRTWAPELAGMTIHDRPITQDVSLDVWLKERGVRKGGLTADTAVLGL